MNNRTIPTTIGALLTEEYTIDPLSSLPSFLELTFVDVARNSGRRALALGWRAGLAWLEGALARLRQLERLATRRAARSQSGGSSPSSRALGVVRAIAIGLRRARARCLRRACQLFLRTMTAFGPELQALLMFAIDYHCLHYVAGATACEMVYGLKRSRVVREPPPPRSRRASGAPAAVALPLSKPGAGGGRAHRVAELTPFDKTGSALLATLLPYWKERCDRCYSEYSGGSLASRASNDSSTHQSTFEETKQYFVQCYPYFHMLHEGSIFLYQFAYLVGGTHYWSFSLHALGVMLRRMTVVDVQQQQQKQVPRPPAGSPAPGREPPASGTAPTPSKTPMLPTTLSMPQLLRGAVLLSVSYTLLSGWSAHFRRQLRARRRRWIAGDEDAPAAPTPGAAPRRRAQLPIPPPPRPPTARGGEGRRPDTWSCPLCREPRINPTASTSGYVFCYKCLVSHLRRRGEYCPVTGMSCPEDRVVRLYEPTASQRGTGGGGEDTDT